MPFLSGAVENIDANLLKMSPGVGFASCPIRCERARALGRGEGHGRPAVLDPAPVDELVFGPAPALEPGLQELESLRQRYCRHGRIVGLAIGLQSRRLLPERRPSLVCQHRR